MQSKNLFLISIFFVAMIFSACGNKKIGLQTWSTTNLDVSTFQNGDIIPEAKTAEEWYKAGIEGKPIWCCYNIDPSNGKKYGKLYNWYAVKDARGIAPKGWHVPSDAEWKTLTAYLGGEVAICAKIKSNGGWEGNYNGSNQSGFEALPGGYCDENMAFTRIGKNVSWWSSTESRAGFAYARSINYNYDFFFGLDKSEQCGLSVRCIRD